MTCHREFKSQRPHQPRQVHYQGRFIRVVSEDGWEWVERINTTGAVVIVPITSRGEVVLVEQYRIPMRASVIELPAGLAGDTSGEAGESLLSAAQRELLEEAGFEADCWEYLTEGPSSAGLATEVFALFLARDARRVAPGGGDAAEEITVHVIPYPDLESWLAQRRSQGAMIDPKVFAGLYFALSRGALASAG